MKKIYGFLLVFAIGVQLSFTQPTADMAFENPRIIGNTFNFDIYFKRTNSHASWFETPDSAMLRDCSTVFTINSTDLTYPPTITYVNPAIFPAGAGYSHGFFNYGFAWEVNTAGPGSVPVAMRRNMELDRWYLMYTVSITISGTVSNLSNIGWFNFGAGTAFNAIGNVSNFPDNFYDSGCNLAMDTKSWTGSANGDWDNANNWSPTGVPSGVDIIYPNNPTNHLSGMAVSSYGDIQNLRVNHLAEMPIPQNCGVTVTGNVTLMGGSRNIICEAGTGATEYSSAFIPEGTINYNGYVIESGHIEVHRTLYYTNTSANYYMHMVAAPVDGVILDDWDMIHFNTYAYEWDTGLQNWWNIHVPSRNTPPGYGFILSLWDIGAASTEDLVFYDNLVLNDVTPTFSLATFEYALLGNPYTAPINWDVLAPQVNIYNSVWVWNPATGNYVSYVNGSGGNPSAHYIQPGQAFFIEANNNATQFIISANARTQNIEPYMKDMPTNLLRVYTEGGNETVDEVYIRFKEGEVTSGFDENHDCDDWPSGYDSLATEIYTVGSDGRKLSIDARPQISDEQQSVALSFKPTMEAEYKLHADEESMNSFASSIKIMLEDTFNPEMDWVDMRAEGSYTFNSAPGDPLDRFILHFWDTEFGIDDGELAQPIHIYSDRTDAIIVNDSEQLIKEILVYDIAGNLIANKATVNNYSTRIYVSDEVGYYVVKVITNKAVYSEKVLISK